jgi:AbrB family looped-hinge helix DNA binding protein
MVTFNGRITLPPHVRKQLGLKTGDSVEFVEIGNGHFAIASGQGSTTGSIQELDRDPRGWMPKLEFSASAEEPRFKEMDEAIH